MGGVSRGAQVLSCFEPVAFPTSSLATNCPLGVVCAARLSGAPSGERSARGRRRRQGRQLLRRVGAAPREPLRPRASGKASLGALLGCYSPCLTIVASHPVEFRFVTVASSSFSISNFRAIPRHNFPRSNLSHVDSLFLSLSGLTTTLTFLNNPTVIKQVKLLLGSGALVSAYTRADYTPLHFAAGGGHLPVLKQLEKVLHDSGVSLLLVTNCSTTCTIVEVWVHPSCSSTRVR